MVNGIVVAAIELGLYFLSSFIIRRSLINEKKIDIISYYWFMMTILTFIWEVSFIIDYSNVTEVSRHLLETKTHVWTNGYDLSYILPWKVARIFYGEYGAYADRDYMNMHDDWSRVIEGTHAIFCGIFALWAILSKMRADNKHYLITASISMGSQLMNSLLYMANYFNETHNSSSVNYDTTSFPTGHALSNRPFMYVNLFWTIMPAYVILRLLCTENWFPKRQDKLLQNTKLTSTEIAGL